MAKWEITEAAFVRITKCVRAELDKEKHRCETRETSIARKAIEAEDFGDPEGIFRKVVRRWIVEPEHRLTYFAAACFEGVCFESSEAHKYGKALATAMRHAMDHFTPTE